MMNIAAVEGRIAADCDLRITKKEGKSVVNFTLCVPCDNDKNEYDTVSCIAWNRNAEIISEYCKKGKLISVQGKNKTRMRKTNDGGIEFVQEINVTNVYFL